MATSPYMFICLCCFFLVNCQVRESTDVSYSSEISAVLDYLNSVPFKVYNYKEATLLNAHTKTDITELALEINVDCVNKYPHVPCSERVLTCSAFVRNTPEKGSQVLNDVNCTPKPEIIIEEPTYEATEVVVNEPLTIALSNEAVSSEVGESFVAVKKETYPCLGCPFDLNPEAKGVDELIDIALEHVGTERDKKQTLVKVLKLQQQVVSGVKYFLVVEMAPTICAKGANLDSCPRDTASESFICEVVFLQKPWISKVKHVIGNNCTVSQEYFKPDIKRSDMSNEIDSNDHRKPQDVPNPNFDRIAETGTIEQMSPSRLSELESLIVVEDDFVPNNQAEVPSTVEANVETSETPEDVEESPTTETEDRAKRDESSEETETPPEERNDASEDDSSEEDIHDARMKRSDESPESVEQANATNSSEEISSEEANRRERRSEESPESLEATLNATLSPASEESSEEANKRERRSEESPESLEATLNATLSPASEESSEEKKRNKRAIPQLEKISPDEKGLVRNLADFAAAALDNIDDDNHRRIILQILGAKKMVGDDGVYYHLIMRMGISRCMEDKPPHPYENCREKLFENYTKICKVQVYVNDDFGTPKVVKSQCQNIKRDKNDSNRTNYSRFRRDVLVGGQSNIDKNSEKIKELLRQGVTHLNAQSNKDNKYKPLEVISATSQVVAGVSYRIKVRLAESDCSINDQKEPEECNVREGASPTTCEIKVWEKSWQNFRKFTVKCDNGENVSVQTGISRKKRQIPGGENSVDKNDKDVKQLLREGVTHLNVQSSKNNKYKPVEVISATKQVVAGFITRIKVRVTESDCSKSDQKDLEDCNVLEGASPTTCDVEVWEKDWENFKRFTVKCENGENVSVQTGISRKKRQVPGGRNPVDTNDKDVKQLLREGVTHLNAQSSKNNKYKPVEVISATQQVVAGFITRIKVRVTESDCSKTDQKDLDDCNVLEGASPTTCNVEVWEKSWENFKQFTVDCENGENFKVKSRSKRQVNDVNVEKLLRQSVTELNARTNNDNKYKPVEVVSATRQVVAGLTYRIKVKVAESDCAVDDERDFEDCNVQEDVTPILCDVKVWEKSWQNFRQFKVNCENGENFNVVTDSRNFGEDKRSKKDLFVEEYLESGLSQLDMRSPHENKLKVDQVLSVSKQTVSGHIYNIKAKIVLSDCEKVSDEDRRTCGTLEGATPQICTFKVYEAIWRPNSRMINITCGEDEYSFGTIHRGLLGNDDPRLHFALFNDFVKKYDKKYSKKEFKYRLKVFSDNLMHIRLLNTYEQGSAQYGVTKFADLTQQEFSKSLGLRTDLRNDNEAPFAQAKIPDLELPKEFDWRTKGVVSEVKNQEQCGSCWAFSVTGNVEGQYAIKHGELLEFSEQELVDCDTEDQGCDGGLMDNAYRQIEKLGGLETEQDYPYDAEDEKCHFNRTLARVQLTGALNISHNETDMAKWLVANGPISIAINANAMQFYMGGVSHPFKFLCSPKNLDHGVLIVGYGVHTYSLFNKTLPYWIVKNSWGTSWGEQGYYRVYRGDGTCGLNQTPSSAIVA